MKLKKKVNVVLVLVLLIIIGGSFYTFNRWFFTKYKDVGKKVENQNVENNKESVENMLDDSTNKKEEIENKKQEENNTTLKEDSIKQNKKKIRPSEIYYCSDGDVLDEKECIMKVETSATKIVMNTNDERKYFQVIIDINEDIVPIMKEACEEENGIFELMGSKGACNFLIDEDDSEKIIGYSCMDGYTKDGDKCIKEVRIPAKVRYDCQEGYILEGAYCILK